MEFRAVGNRCAVDIKALNLPISDAEAMLILKHKGFRIVEVDLVALARQCMTTSCYRRGAKPSEAPGVVDCSSFVKWLYGQRGIWLPRRSIQQRQYGETVSLDRIARGDLIFTSGWIDYWLDDPNDGVGHVGIVTDDGSVIHAANRRVGVIESSIDQFTECGLIFRGAIRHAPQGREVLTLETPPHREVETADDIRWIVMQSLPRREP